MKTSKGVILNSVANIFGKMWSMLSIIIFMPLYIKYMGEEQYGLVSFFTTFQTLLLLMNGGFNTSIKREFAIKDENKTDDRKYHLLRSTEFLFLILSVLVISLVSSFSSIATKWLNIGTLNKHYVVQSIDLIGVTIVLQVFSSLYLGCLQGLEQQITANISQSLFYLIRNLGALLIVKYVSPDVRLFFICYIISEIVFIIVNRSFVLHCISHAAKWHICDFIILKSIFTYTMGIFGISVISVFNAQLDKVLISKYMNLSDITYYSIASSVGQVPLLLVNAIAIAFFPKLVQALSRNDKQVAPMFKKCSSLFSLVSIPITCFMSVAMYHLILLWQMKPETAQYTFVPAIMLTIANSLYCLQVTADNCLLAEKNTNILIYKNLGSMALSLTTMVILIPKYGLLGGALSYLCVAFFCWLIYGGYVHRYYTQDSFIKWAILFVVIPTLISVVISVGSSLVINQYNINSIVFVSIMVFLGVLTLLLLIKCYSKKLQGFNDIQEE